MKVFDRSRPRSAQDAYRLGAAVVWAAIWLGTAVALQGSGHFASMIPILAVGTGWFLAVSPAQYARRQDTSAPE